MVAGRPVDLLRLHSFRDMGDLEGAFRWGRTGSSDASRRLRMLSFAGWPIPLLLEVPGRRNMADAVRRRGGDRDTCVAIRCPVSLLGRNFLRNLLLRSGKRPWIGLTEAVPFCHQPSGGSIVPGPCADGLCPRLGRESGRTKGVVGAAFAEN